MSKYIWLIPIYLFVQIFVLNQILFASYINPYLYIILIITIPKDKSKSLILIYSFFLGLLIDIFSGTIGFHSTASTFLAFSRPFLTKISIPYNMVNEQDQLNIYKLGVKSFILLSFLSCFIHHFVLFFLENMTFDNFFNLFIKILFSSVITTILILLTQLAFTKRK